MNEKEIRLVSDGRRLDVQLSESAGISRSRAAALMEEGCCLLDGAPCRKAGTKPPAGREVVLAIPEPKDPVTKPTVKLRESSQAWRVVEDPSSPYGYYYFYGLGDEVRYKIIVENKTEATFYNLEVGTELKPLETISIEKLAPEETRSFYIWFEVGSINGDRDTMERDVWMSFEDENGIGDSVRSDPCEVPIGLVPAS